MAEWVLYGIRPNMSISSVIADNDSDVSLLVLYYRNNGQEIVLLNAGFICKEDAMVYWRFREHAGCHHLFLTRTG